MRFYFDVDESELYYGCDFKEAIFNGVVDEIAMQILSGAINPDRINTEIHSKINELLKSKQDEIVESIISRVADKIERKKQIVAITPKASELAVINKDNVSYFEEMIDRAIAKKFGKD